MVPQFDMLLDFSIRRKFRDLRFRRYSQARKKLHQLCEFFVEGRDAARTVVGFGNWSCTDYGGFIKKCIGGLSKRLEREFQKYFRVEPEDEYCTSPVHFGCPSRRPQDPSQQYQRRECRDGVVHLQRIHSVLHCKACGTTVNRDVNALRNILLMFQLTARSTSTPCLLQVKTKLTSKGCSGADLDGCQIIAGRPCVGEGYQYFHCHRK